MTDRVRAIAISCGGLGYLRPAPGTWGSMPPAALAVIMLWGGAPGWSITAAMGAVLIVSCVICLALGDWAETHYGRKDASNIVIDETAGQAISLMFWPAAFIESARALGPDGGIDWTAAIRGAVAVGGAFVLFRIMDIVKPPPARGLQRLRGGLGVLIDDLIAGIYAALLVQIALRWLA